MENLKNAKYYLNKVKEIKEKDRKLKIEFLFKELDETVNCMFEGIGNKIEERVAKKRTRLRLSHDISSSHLIAEERVEYLENIDKIKKIKDLGFEVEIKCNMRCHNENMTLDIDISWEKE